MEEAPGPHEFATTHWSLVAAMQESMGDSARARLALEELCRRYWYPLYAFVRHRGYSADDAQDLTQAFFARIIETAGLTSVDREKGRFRSYLIGALKHFLANEWHRQRAQKRGGAVQIIEWDALDPESRYAHSSCGSEDPEHAFDREWALEIIDGAMRALRDEMIVAGKGEQFDALRGSLLESDAPPRDDIAARLNMSEGALKVAIHRLRRRYRMLLRDAIAETVRNEADLEDEMRYLITVLRKS